MITEGYFIEYKNVIWAVKGCTHPKGYVVAIPRKIGNNKIKTFSEGMKIVRERFPDILRYEKKIGFEVPLIPLDESKVFDPFSFKSNDKNINEFLSLFDDVGVTGSWLYEGKGNDIDIITFNQKNYDILKKLREERITSPLNSVNEKEIEILEYNDFKSLKQNRVLEGIYKGIPYTFKIVNCEDFGEVKFTTSFDGTVTIIKAEKNFTIPVKYVTKEGYIATSFRTRFTELPLGTKLYVKGIILHRENFNDLDLDIAEKVKII
ncbi:hypothetical protein DFR86_02015 [Acidianus sulfidivorans JP7]|uniref:Uncharacterized protein n=1 Tax=Acidianus sulfidivorans JP7 TaxID=619593 RepID=A0A2U9IK95_9CREN|nr:hypothetical protein [Acidianus sulfidivorans]AWR96443.1 hypothetical protein DFR86_02015 [Acidianus sulfidivorans JP7]